MTTMYLQWISVALLSTVLALGGGCKKSTPAGQAAASTPARGTTVLHLHWLGKKSLATETNAAALMDIWNLPESARLEKQTLDKLALAPWLMVHGTEIYNPKSLISNYQAYYTNYPAATLIRPLLDDLVQEESDLEIQNLTNQPGELALAIKLNDQQAALWQTNLAAALELITGAKSAPNPAGGWQVQFSRASDFLLGATAINLSHSGAWTLIVVTWREAKLEKEIEARLKSTPLNLPGRGPSNDCWLEFSFDPAQCSHALGVETQWAPKLPKVTAITTGEGKQVRIHGHLDFHRPLTLQLEPWRIPTNIVSDPLISFSAVRGIGPWLSKQPAWLNFGLEHAPEQAFAWSQDGLPFFSYCALYVPQASNFIYSLSARLETSGNTWLGQNAMGRLKRPEAGLGIAWTDLAFVVPFLKLIRDQNDVLLGGMVPATSTNKPPPRELLAQVTSQTNLVYYGWELTGPRAETWLQMGQLLRVFFHRPQLPSGCSGMEWLKAVETKLGNSATAVQVEASNRLSFVRKSSAGLSGLEIQLLLDWLESPQFPKGLYTTCSPRLSRQEALPHSTHQTNSTAAPKLP